MLWPTLLAALPMDTAGEAETQTNKITEQASCLKKVTPSVGSFSDLQILTGLGLRAHDSEMRSRYWELSYLLY